MANVKNYQSPCARHVDTFLLLPLDPGAALTVAPVGNSIAKPVVLFDNLISRYRILYLLHQTEHFLGLRRAT
jgi:hypothetical protein